MNTSISSKKLYLLGLFGNVAEWYDFSIYAFLAPVLGEIFFASSTRQLALIKAFAIFSISYLARPIGSICFGYIGDRFGRRVSLRYSLLLMAVPAILIGTLPTYSSVGLAATILLIILRFTQGLATGGEYPGIACYVYEAAEPQKRNFFCSIAVASPAIGMFLGSSVATLLHTFISEENIQSWGWRIPFLLSFFVLLFIFYIRKNLEETAEFTNKSTQSDSYNYNTNLWQELLLYKKSFLRAITIWIFLEIAFYLLFVWMPSYLNVFLNFAADKSFLNSSIGLLSIVVVTLFTGYFAENVQPKKIIFLSILGIMLFSYPLFLLLQLKTLSIIIMVQLIFALFVGALCGVAMCTVSSLFNTKIRCLSLGISVTIASGIFGGMSPTICSYLINKTGYTLAPVFFLIAAGVVALISTLTLKPKEL